MTGARIVNAPSPLKAALPACLLAAALSFGHTPPSRADIYSFTDERGVVHLSNHATDERDVVLLKQPEPPPPAAPATQPNAAQLAAMPYAKLVDAAADRQHVDRALLHAVIATESRYNPAAVSPKGARGLMQLMPDTAQRYGVVNVLDPAQNIQGGSRYLKDLLERFNQNLGLSLAAYNAGENAVARYGNRIPPYRETQNYVAEVMSKYRQLTADR